MVASDASAATSSLPATTIIEGLDPAANILPSAPTSNIASCATNTFTLALCVSVPVVLYVAYQLVLPTRLVYPHPPPSLESHEARGVFYSHAPPSHQPYYSTNSHPPPSHQPYYSTISPVRKSLIIPHFVGRLGNHMFILASTIGLAMDTLKDNITGVVRVVDDHCAPSLYFLLQSPHILHAGRGEASNDVTCRALSTRYDEPEDDACSYSPKVLAFNEMHAADKRCFYGYFQSYKYFERYKQELLKVYRFTDVVMDVVREEKAKIRNQFGLSSPSLADVTYVGVHVRRGDYVKPYFQKFGYVAASREYLTRAMEFMYRNLTSPDTRPRIIFIVAGQDTTWNKQNINASRYEVWFSEGLDAGEDMALLANCNHSLLTVGSFGWWSAFLKPHPNSITVYMKNYAHPGSRLSTILNGQDYYPPHWVAI